MRADAQRSLLDLLNGARPALSWQERQAILTYNVDEADAWLRTTDFTAANAFGRAFAYRCGSFLAASRQLPGGCCS
jgi:hypothetical protein